MIASGISNVLLLDDEARVHAAFAELPLSQQLALRPVHSPADARRVMEAVQVDVAVVDQHLGDGEIDGLAFLAELRERDPDCFRIILAGGADLDFAVHAINRGIIDAFLPKPWGDEQASSLLIQGCETALLRRHNRALLDELALRNQDLLEFNVRLEQMVADRTRNLREAHERLTTQQQELVRLETQASVGQLARGLAHELNNPLGAIMGYAQRLRREHLGQADSIRRLDVILTEVERCRGLVDGLRRLAAPLDEESVPCRPADLITDAITRLRVEGHVVPPVKLLGELPGVLAAPRALTKILAQVLENAQQAGARHVWISARTEHDRVQLLCENDGETPSEETLRNAVRPFYTTRAQEGHRGLGLSIASGLLQEQDGCIDVLVRPSGPGALVVISLPPRIGSGSRPAIGNRVATEGPVLVVDDEPLVAELLADTLAEQHLPATVVGTIAAAHAALAAGPIRAMLVDLTLPDGDGMDLVHFTLTNYPQLRGRIGIITGSQCPDLAGQDIPLLVKPFRLDQLGKLVRKLV